jgi:hypothetical protein
MRQPEPDRIHFLKKKKSNQLKGNHDTNYTTSIDKNHYNPIVERDKSTKYSKQRLLGVEPSVPRSYLLFSIGHQLSAILTLNTFM